MVYPQWGPWRKAGCRSEGDAAANGKGAVYWLEGSKRYGLRYPVSVEEILDVEPRPLRNLYPVIVAGLVKAAEAPQS